MPAIRGLTVAVGEWYARTLEICLARNMRHLTECWVITTPQDEAVKAVARSVPDVHIHETNDFTSHGARFNKGLCIETCFDVMGRHGWILIHDADILFPPALPLERLHPDRLHGCRRRTLDDPTAWRPDLHWHLCPQVRDGGPIGFFQLFHADAPDLSGRRPWYDVSFAHAGGGDAYFMQMFHLHRRTMLPMEVLHLGPIDTHWFGTDAAARDTMAAFVHRNGWTRAMATSDPTAKDRVPSIPERVAVPGYEPSNFELPFVRRSRDQA